MGKAILCGNRRTLSRHRRPSAMPRDYKTLSTPVRRAPLLPGRRWSSGAKRPIISSTCCGSRTATRSILFNGRDGAWLGKLTHAGKKGRDPRARWCRPRTRRRRPTSGSALRRSRPAGSTIWSRRRPRWAPATCSRCSPSSRRSRHLQARQARGLRARGRRAVRGAEPAPDRARDRARRSLIDGWRGRRAAPADLRRRGGAVGLAPTRQIAAPGGPARSACWSAPRADFPTPSARCCWRRISSSRSASARASCAPTPPPWPRWRSSNQSSAIGDKAIAFALPLAMFRPIRPDRHPPRIS